MALGSNDLSTLPRAKETNLCDLAGLSVFFFFFFFFLSVPAVSSLNLSRAGGAYHRPSNILVCVYVGRETRWCIALFWTFSRV